MPWWNHVSHSQCVRPNVSLHCIGLDVWRLPLFQSPEKDHDQNWQCYFQIWCDNKNSENINKLIKYVTYNTIVIQIINLNPLIWFFLRTCFKTDKIKLCLRCFSMTFVYALWPNHWQVLKMTITSLADPEFPVEGANTPPVCKLPVSVSVFYLKNVKTLLFSSSK